MSPRRLGLALALWNNAANRQPGFQRAYVPVNLALTATVLALGRRAGLDRAALGLGSGQLRPGLAWGAASSFVAAGLAVSARRRFGCRLADQRLAGQRLGPVLAVRIPLGTALPEEVAFRGVLLGLAGGRTRQSNLAFGLWHVTPTLALVAANRPHAGPVVRAAVTGAGVLATATFGALQCRLRRATGGVLAPVLVHAALNCAAAWASRPFPATSAPRSGLSRRDA